jgi:hypothetical protein
MTRSMKLSTDAPWSSLAHRSWCLDGIMAVALGWSEQGVIGDGGSDLDISKDLFSHATLKMSCDMLNSA